MRPKGKSFAYAVLLLLIVTPLLLTGCARSKEQAPHNFAPAPVPAGERSVPDEQFKSALSSEGDHASSGGDLSVERAASERKIIYTDDIKLIVNDSKKTVSRIREQVRAAGGYVADEHTWLEGDQLRATLTLRVPLGAFDSFMNDLRGLALRVDDERLSSRDVTDQYVDLQAQLRNLEATEKELQTLLTDVRKRTQRASDIMEVYRELSKVRGQIDQAKGRMQMLDKLTTFATVNVTLVPDALSRPVITAPWRPAVTVHNAVRMLQDLTRGFLNALIYFVLVVVPFLLMVGIPLYLLVLLVRWLARKRPRRAKPAAAPDGKTD